MPADCENCGRTDADLVRVHRVYLIPEEITVSEVEWWCASCRTQYPHQEVEAP